MTLVELLVVVAILLLLSVVTVPNIAGTIEARRIREAARSVSSFVARSQSRAIGSPVPRGLILQPTSADPDIAIDLFFADVPEEYAGDSVSSRAVITWNNPNQPTRAELAYRNDGGVDAETTNRLTNTDICRSGDSIQFGGRGAYFRWDPPNLVTMWADNGRSNRNTPWPRPGPEGLSFKISRQPTRASTGVLQLQRGAAIDLAWSVLGSRVLSNTLPDAALGPGITGRVVTDQSQPICVLFDSAGKPTEMFHSGGMRTVIAEPLFLLIGLTDLCGNTPVVLAPGESAALQKERRGANWQYGDSAWLCIDNNTGITKFGPVNPRASSVIESQRYIRMTIGIGVTER
jgi:type II secretory pathway pseudopilin PulG